MSKVATVRSSTQFYLRFNLLMDRSPGFGSTNMHCVCSIKARFHYASGIYLKLAHTSNSLDRSTKSTQSLDKPAPTPCTHTISESISLPFRGSFNLSLAVLVHYRSHYIFSLGTWSSQIQAGFLVPRSTRQTWIISPRQLFFKSYRKYKVSDT